MNKRLLALGFLCLFPIIAQAAIGISTPSVNSGELIRASDWNKVKLDLETLAAAVGSLQNQSWGSSGSDIFYNAGNVGIGTNSPTGTLHLFADTPASNAVLLQLGTTDDADRVRIDAEGDMTIDGKLLVRDSDIYESGGDLELSGEDSLYLSMDWNNNDGDTQNIYFGKNSDGAGANFAELMRLTEAGDLGVGVATPLSKVHVGGAIQIGGDAAPCVAAKAGAIRYDGGAIERCDGANWDALATTNVSDNLGSHVAEQNLDLDAFRLVGEGGTEGLAIDVNGTVGIGTDNPTTLLDVTNDQTPVLTVRTTAVNGQDAAVAITGAQTTSTTADVASIRLNNKDGAPFEGARISLRNGDSTDATAFGDLVFSTNTGGADNLSEKMRILDSGAVGIGTSDPVAQLQVLKNGPVPNEVVFQVGTNSDDRRFYVDEDGDFYSDGNAFVTGSLRSENSGLTVGAEDSLYLSADWNNNDADNRSIIFGKNGVGGGGGFSEIARFNENGRFGLNVNNPANLLHVGGTETADRIAVIENLATTGSPEGLLVLTGQGAGPAPALAVGTGTESSHTNKFVVTNAGNVGIGTQNPGRSLEIVGSGVKISDPGSVVLELYGAGDDWRLQGNTGLNFYNVTDSASTMFMDDTGNVGIGTTSPSEGRVQVVQAANTSSDGITVTNAAVSSTLRMWHDGIQGRLSVGSNGTGKLVINNGGGNVGIGTTNPGAKFTVRPFATLNQTTISWDTLIGSGDSAESVIGGGTGIKLTASTANTGKAAGIASVAESTWANTMGLALFTSNDGNTFTEKVRISGTGNVGIGTTSPRAKLDVQNGNSSQTYSNISGLLVDVNGTSNSYYALQVGSSTGKHFSVTNAGNVGIGTTNPSAKLEVNGETRLSGVSSDGTGKVVCIKSTGDLGTCTNAPNGSGVCSCS